MNHEPTPHDEPDDELDKLANQVGSLDQARAMLGLPSAYGQLRPKTWEEHVADSEKPASRQLTSAQRRRAARAAMGPQYGEEAGVGYLGGKPPEHQDFGTLSDEQRAINAAGMLKVRDALADARRRRES